MRVIWVSAVALGLASCSDKASEDDTGGDADAALAAELWSDMDGYASWWQDAEWTGIQPSDDGTHGDYVQIWFNTAVADTLGAAAGGDMPDGAILVKEGYDDEAGATVAGLTAMRKIAGYAPDGGDWFWAKFDPATGEVLKAGEDDSCSGCHLAGQDYVRFQTW